MEKKREVCGLKNCVGRNCPNCFRVRAARVAREKEEAEKLLAIRIRLGIEF